MSLLLLYASDGTVTASIAVTSPMATVAITAQTEAPPTEPAIDAGGGARVRPHAPVWVEAPLVMPMTRVAIALVVAPIDEDAIQQERERRIQAEDEELLLAGIL